MFQQSASPRLPASFNRLAWSNLAAQSAEQIGLAAAPIVAVLALGAGAGATGLVQTAQTLPFLLLSVPAGVLADRASRRRLMAGAEALRALSLAGVLTLAHLARAPARDGRVVESLLALAVVAAVVAFPTFAMLQLNRRDRRRDALQATLGVCLRELGLGGMIAVQGSIRVWLGGARGTLHRRVCPRQRSRSEGATISSSPTVDAIATISPDGATIAD